MLDELNIKLEELKARINELRGFLDVDAKKQGIQDCERQMFDPNFWQDSKKANEVVRTLKELKSNIESWERCFKEYNAIVELIPLVEPSDTKSLKELHAETLQLEKEVEQLEKAKLLGDKDDRYNAILSIHAGAGGTESCDWTAMLFRMYSRWAQIKDYSFTVLDYLAGEEAGIKSATVLIKGSFAFGYLKAETGVHRLVRISPFDSNKRRHTSFASVDVIPEIEEDIDIQIKDEEIRVDVYRATGPGGQGVNTTDSAVRITHLPTNIVVQCQNERSQLRNKQVALKILKVRLYRLEREKREKEFMEKYGQKQKIEWGSQIRSYVLHPYNMVKDHRTDVETGNTGSVLDGNLDMFIEEYLKKMAKGR
ncbi:MAG: peptide chain release factor 2 [Candidatus Omnitrophota bacterium]